MSLLKVNEDATHVNQWFWHRSDDIGEEEVPVTDTSEGSDEYLVYRYQDLTSCSAVEAFCKGLEAE